MLRLLFIVLMFISYPALAASGSGTDGSGSWTPLPDPSFPGGGGSFGGNSGGGSWGNSGGFGGNNGSGSPPAGSAGDSYNQCNYISADGSSHSSAESAGKANCQHFRGTDFLRWQQSPPSPSRPEAGVLCAGSSPSGGFVIAQCQTKVIPECRAGQHFDGSNCVKDLKCPKGYEKQGNKCIWQCPAGMKKQGDNCVKEDTPEDCDPAIQTCNDDGTPQCDPCAKMQQLINNNLTMVNNDNRVITLNETMISQNETINNNISNVNSSLSVINNNMSTMNSNVNNINTSIQTTNTHLETLINTINENKPDFDTSNIENKLDTLNDTMNNLSLEIDPIEVDMTETNQKLEDLILAVQDNKYDDTELKAKLDELVIDLTPLLEKLDTINQSINDKADETMGWLDTIVGLLKDIKAMMLDRKESDFDTSLDLPEAEQNDFDPWGALTGFDINQNRINASTQCPADKTFQVMGATMSLPMSHLCSFLAMLGPVFLILAYFQGARIILNSGD